MNKSSIDFELQILLDEGINYINQFMTFEDFDSGNSKLETIKDNKLYAGFSWGFNDIFDSQLRLSFLDRIELFQKIINHLSLEDINITYLDNIRTMLHLMSISCFTELDPLNLKSDHMWGLYAKSGTGICIQYKIEDIKNFVISGTREPWTIKKVQYNDFIDKPKIFEDLITVAKSSKVNNHKEVNKYLQLFNLSKLMTWCAEKEWRFISPINIQNYFNKDLSKCSVYPPYEAIRDGFYPQVWFNKFNFVKPARIIFGWNCDFEKNNNYKLLMEYCKKDNNLEYIMLDKYIDYSNNLYALKKPDK
jgi:hypothetical protein